MEFICETFYRSWNCKKEYKNRKFYYFSEWKSFFQTIDVGYFEKDNKFIFSEREFTGLTNIDSIINNLFMYDQDELAIMLYKRFVKI